MLVFISKTIREWAMPSSGSIWLAKVKGWLKKNLKILVFKILIELISIILPINTWSYLFQFLFNFFLIEPTNCTLFMCYIRLTSHVLWGIDTRIYKIQCCMRWEKEYLSYETEHPMGLNSVKNYMGGVLLGSDTRPII